MRKFPVETLKDMEVWLDDPNYHVRRLVSESTRVEVQEILLVQAELRPGETLEFSIELVAHRPELLVIDYEIEFVKSNGGRSGKIFKGVTLNLGKGEWAKFSKRHKLLAQATTYRLYPGEHKLTIQVNGQPIRSVPFAIR